MRLDDLGGAENSKIFNNNNTVANKSALNKSHITYTNNSTVKNSMGTSMHSNSNHVNNLRKFGYSNNNNDSMSMKYSGGMYNSNK